MQTDLFEKVKISLKVDNLINRDHDMVLQRN